MSEEEAITLLAGCKTLVRQLVATNCTHELTGADLKVLRGFRRVWLAGLTKRELVRQAAGLTTEEMVVLLGTLVLYEWQIT
jgi:hypothetical protein